MKHIENLIVKMLTGITLVIVYGAIPFIGLDLLHLVLTINPAYQLW